MENLIALVTGMEMTPYQRALAQREFERMIERLEIYENAVKNNAVSPNVSSSLLCIFDSVEGEGLTIDKYYDPLCKYKDCYCIVDDHDELGVYHKSCFKIVSNEC